MLAERAYIYTKQKKAARNALDVPTHPLVGKREDVTAAAARVTIVTVVRKNNEKPSRAKARLGLDVLAKSVRESEPSFAPRLNFRQRE